MSVNRVWLIGVVSVAARPTSDELGGGEVTLLAALLPGADETVERFRIRSLTDPLPAVGSEVLIEGAVVTQGARRVVLASRVAVLAEPGERTALGAPEGGTHAPPTPHQRRGHWRMLGRGTIRERLVWVRTTRVGQ